MSQVTTVAPSSQFPSDVSSEIALLENIASSKPGPITQATISEVAPLTAATLARLYLALTGKEIDPNLGTLYGIQRGQIYFPAVYKTVDENGSELMVLRWGDELIPLTIIYVSPKEAKEKGINPGLQLDRESAIPDTLLEFAISNYSEGNFKHFTLAIHLYNELNEKGILYHLPIKREDYTLKLDDASGWPATFSKNPGKLLEVLATPQAGGQTVSPNLLALGRYLPVEALQKGNDSVPDAWIITLKPVEDGDTIQLINPEGTQGEQVDVQKVYATRQQISRLNSVANGSTTYRFDSDCLFLVTSEGKSKRTGKRTTESTLVLSDKAVKASVSTVAKDYDF